MIGCIEPAEPVGDRLADAMIGRPQRDVAREQPRRPVLGSRAGHGRVVGRGAITEGQRWGVERGRNGVGHRGLRGWSSMVRRRGRARMTRGDKARLVKPPPRSGWPEAETPTTISATSSRDVRAGDTGRFARQACVAASMASTLASRRRWRGSPLNVAPTKASTHSYAGSGPMTRAPSVRTFMSSCSTPWCAE